MTDSAPTYTMGYDEDFCQMLNWRSAETHAKHLLPHLEPGLSLLDFGCGPGTLSVGLARAVEPGEFHGIDIERSQVGLARSAAAAGGHTNASFQVGDVTDLPFDDNTFDVAHCHTVLNHVPDTLGALGGVKRVLKPSGIISCRELVAESCFSEPAYNLGEAWAVFAKLVAANGGHPQMGKALKSRLVKAGFADIRATASFDTFSSPEGIAFLHGVVTEWFFSPKVITAATTYGLATHQQFDGWRLAQDQVSNLRWVAAGPGSVEKPSWSPRGHRLRRGHSLQAVI